MEASPLSSKESMASLIVANSPLPASALTTMAPLGGEVREAANALVENRVTARTQMIDLILILGKCGEDVGKVVTEKESRALEREYIRCSDISRFCYSVVEVTRICLSRCASEEDGPPSVSV